MAHAEPGVHFEGNKIPSVVSGWVVYRGYAIKGTTIVVSDTSTMRVTFPASFQELPTEISQLQPGDENAVMTFVANYGLLTTRRQSEALIDVWQEAARLRATLRVLAAKAKLTTRDREVIARDVSQHLRGTVHQTIQPAPGGFRRVTTADSLVSLAWWQVSECLTEARRVRRCRAPKCGQLFLVSHQRQRFCPPREDQRDRNGKGESRCGWRARKAHQRPNG